MSDDYEPTPAYAADFVNEALDYIIEQTRWANAFPKKSLERIRLTCEAVKAGQPLPFKRILKDLGSTLPVATL
jgi:hypothetical protein